MVVSVKKAIRYIVTRPIALFIRVQEQSGLLLLVCTFVSLWLANSGWAQGYVQCWQRQFVAGVSATTVINDGLMAVFFLLIGIELRRELAFGELKGTDRALLPIAAAIGGMVVPAGLFAFFNAGTPTAGGWGIPMATDIAFSLAVLHLAGNRIPVSVKVLLTALAVVDDLGAIVVIACFYSSHLQWMYLAGAILLFVFLRLLSRRVTALLWPYLLGGAGMWWLMHHSGIHATLAGVLMAFALPLSQASHSLMMRLEEALHKPVNFVIMPLFALANTAIMLSGNAFYWPPSSLAAGIIAGLLVGKPTGIFLFALLVIRLGLAHLPVGIRLRHLISVGLLGGIGFTMSVFITVLAFPGHVVWQNDAKIAIIAASVFAGAAGLLLVSSAGKEA